MRKYILGMLTAICAVPILESLTELIQVVIEVPKGMLTKKVMVLNKDIQDLQAAMNLLLRVVLVSKRQMLNIMMTTMSTKINRITKSDFRESVLLSYFCRKKRRKIYGKFCF